jgi:hypothetical protein
MSPNLVIPDGQGGALAAWTDFLNSCNFNVSHVTSQGIMTYPLPLNTSCNTIGTPTMVLGENGTAFATNGSNLVSFDINSGQVSWSYAVPAEYTFSIITSVTGNSLVGKITDQNTIDTIISFDPTGIAVQDTWTGTNVSYWAGNSYPASSSAGVTTYSANLVQFSSSPLFEPSSSGTNQAAQNLGVGSASNTGPNQTAIINIFGKINKALIADATSQNPKCSNWLQGSGTTASQVIQALLDNNTFGHGVFTIQTYAAVHGFKNLDGSPTGIPANFAITVNDLGAYFEAMDVQGRSFQVGKRNYSGNTLRAQATILIHELAHTFPAPGFQEDNGKPKAGKANDKLVDRNCRYIIEGLK